MEQQNSRIVPSVAREQYLRATFQFPIGPRTKVKKPSFNWGGFLVECKHEEINGNMSQRIFTQTFGVVGAIIERDGKILLVKETKASAKGKWSHPAGWLEVGENPIDAVKREVKEESGFDFEPLSILGVYSLLKDEADVTHHAIKLIYTGDISDKKTAELADDVSETKWFTPEEIENMNLNTLRDLDIKQMVREYFSGINYPLNLITHTKQPK